MSKSLIRKNQLHPDIADLVGQYGSGVFVTSGDLNNALNNFVPSISLTGENVVYTTGNQTISGIKNFSERPTVNGTGVLLSGEAAQIDLSSTVRTTGDQTVSGVKNFTSRPTIQSTGVLLNTEAVLINTNTYVIAQPGDNLITKYQEAKALTPNDQAKSSTNRASLIIMPGNYSLSTELVIDEEFVDIIGLGAQKLERGAIPAVVISGDTLNVTANDVRVSGISVGEQEFKISSNKPLQKFEDCVGGDYSFGQYVTASGTFVNCIGGLESFGGYGTASGTFTNCICDSSSFGAFGTASGTFINCSGVGNYNFGSGGTASGTFINCTGSDYSFGNSGTASGTFTDCTGGDNSFGSDITGTASGTFINCTGGVYSFGSFDATASGNFINCSGDDLSFGGDGLASGTFTDCTGGVGSFGGDEGGIASGKFYQCRLTVGTFKIVSGAGLMRNCIDGNNNIIDQ